MTDLSLVIPGFRSNRWIDVYNSALQSCTKYSFEIVFVGPYDPPDELKNNPQIKYVKDWGTSTRCAQIGALASSSFLIARTDDDALFFPDGLNQAIDLYHSIGNKKDVVTFRYREGKDFSGQRMEDFHYLAKTAYHTRALVQSLPKKARPNYCFEELHIPDHFGVGIHLMLAKDYFIDIGGFDCVFEHLAWANHDLCYRIQRDGGRIHLSPIETSNVDHCPGAEEHIPVEKSHVEHDMPLIISMHKDQNVVNRIKINIDNWKDSPEVWSRRFPQGKTA